MPPLLRAASNGDVLKLRKLLSGDQGAPSTPTFGGAAATPTAAAGGNPFSNSPVFGASSTPGGGSNPLAATPKERRVAQPTAVGQVRHAALSQQSLEPPLRRRVERLEFQSQRFRNRKSALPRAAVVPARLFFGSVQAVDAEEARHVP